MPEIHLTPDQIGELADDGNITKHPELDAHGQAYTRANATRKRLNKHTFIVLAAGKDSEENVYILPDAKPAEKPAPVVATPPAAILAEALKGKE